MKIHLFGMTERSNYAGSNHRNIMHFSRIPLPMLSTPCESVQICTDPDRYSRIFRKLTSQKNSFEIEIS